MYRIEDLKIRWGDDYDDTSCYKCNFCQENNPSKFALVHDEVDINKGIAVETYCSSDCANLGLLRALW